MPAARNGWDYSDQRQTNSPWNKGGWAILPVPHLDLKAKCLFVFVMCSRFQHGKLGPSGFYGSQRKGQCKPPNQWASKPKGLPFPCLILQQALLYLLQLLCQTCKEGEMLLFPLSTRGWQATLPAMRWLGLMKQEFMTASWTSSIPITASGSLYLGN